jgi:solute carrier family 25 S-adenosylmethionine transporter 26
MAEIEMGEHKPVSVSFLSSLISGGAAGFACDVLLFPLDTVKTRLQSPQGFVASGGFKGIYSGLRVAALGSVPGASLFFCTYESLKKVIPDFHSAAFPSSAPLPDPVVHMAAAGLGEITACFVRVPTEVVKQRFQAGVISRSSSLSSAIYSIYSKEGFRKGFYSGYFSTIMREIPFSFIQFPLYEWMKVIICFSLFLLFFSSYLILL